MELSLLDSEPPTQKTVEIPRSTGAGHRCLPSQVASWTADRGQHLGLVGHLALLLTVELLALAPFTDLLCEIDPGVGVNAMDRQLDPCPCRLGRVRPYRKLEAPSGYLRGRRAKPLGPGQDSGSIPLGPTRRRPDDQPKNRDLTNLATSSGYTGFFRATSARQSRRPTWRRPSVWGAIGPTPNTVITGGPPHNDRESSL